MIGTWRHEFVLTRDHTAIRDRSSLYRDVADRRMVRVISGAYLPAVIWADLSADDRFRAQIVAQTLRHPADVPFSGLSAAAIWGLPLPVRPPSRTESLIPLHSGSRSRAEHRRLQGPADRYSREINGIRVTGLARTVVDVARTCSPEVAVPVADHALRGAAERAGVDRASLRAELASWGVARGRARAAIVVDFADAGSESPGESLSRWVIAGLGFPAPVLQHPVADRSGFVGRVDFWWPDQEIVGEFDGLSKYLDAESPARAVIAEKVREDRLRRSVRRVVRWGWREATEPRRLESLLRAAGLPQSRPNPRGTPESDQRVRIFPS